jgi:hypothetical protein
MKSYFFQGAFMCKRPLCANEVSCALCASGPGVIA